MFVLRLIGVFALIVLNGFFAAAEFSLVAVRISRVRQLVAKGNLRARVVEISLARGLRPMRAKGKSMMSGSQKRL